MRYRCKQPIAYADDARVMIRVDVASACRYSHDMIRPAMMRHRARVYTQMLIIICRDAAAFHMPYERAFKKSCRA